MSLNQYLEVCMVLAICAKEFFYDIEILEDNKVNKMILIET